MEKATVGAVDHSELIQYAQRVTRYTSAPHNWKPNEPGHHITVFPPIPQDSHIKSSLLFQRDLLKAEDDIEKEEEKETENLLEMDILAQTSLVQNGNVPSEDVESLLDLDF
ncbi:hypothetical protein HK098_003900 [Nowakowskiella sp. JEL0407]|nr:hypothetical protein HK098_003900 [Nowakowskiella sp. JEL0407]